MRPSKLFGVLETPGQKAYPSAVFGYNDVNPPQPVFEQGSLIGKVLTNGQKWVQHGKQMPQDSTDFKKLDPYNSNWRRQPLDTTGTLKAQGKASNPDMIFMPGILPKYPLEEEIKMMLNKQDNHKAPGRVEEPKMYMTMLKQPELVNGMYQKRKIAYDNTKINALMAEGYSEEQISKAIAEEEQKDILRILKAPGSAAMTEAKIDKAVETAFSARRVAMEPTTGTNAEGIEGDSGTQNVSVQMANRFVADAFISDLMTSVLAKTGTQARMKETLPAVRQGGKRDVYFTKETLREELQPSGMVGGETTAAGGNEFGNGNGKGNGNGNGKRRIQLQLLTTDTGMAEPMKGTKGGVPFIMKSGSQMEQDFTKYLEKTKGEKKSYPEYVESKRNQSIFDMKSSVKKETTRVQTSLADFFKM